MSRYYGCALAAAFLLAGCEIPPTQDLLELTVLDPTPVQVDVSCDSDSCAPDTLGLEVTFNPHALVDDMATVELVQYRVDYELPGVEEKVPYFAAYTEQVIPFGQTASFTVELAGPAQRAWIRPRLGGSDLNGTATITFGGYDHNNAQVKLESEAIEVTFGAFEQVSQ